MIYIIVLLVMIAVLDIHITLREYIKDQNIFNNKVCIYLDHLQTEVTDYRQYQILLSDMQAKGFKKPAETIVGERLGI